MADLVIHIDKRYDLRTKETTYVAVLKKCRFQRAFNIEIQDVTFEKLCNILKEKLGVTVKDYTFA